MQLTFLMADFQSLFERAPEAYLVLGAEPAYTVLEANLAGRELLGLKREDLAGRPLFAILEASTDDAAGLRASLAEAIATRRPHVVARLPWRLTSRVALAAGEEIWRITHVPLLRDDQVERILQRWENVTPWVRLEQHQREQTVAGAALRARAEQADRAVVQRTEELARTHERLQENERKLQETSARLNVAGRTGEVATWIWDPATDQVYADEILSRWFHLDPAQSQGGPLANFIAAVHSDDREQIRRAIEQVRQTGSNLEIEFRVTDGNGGSRRALARSWAELNPEGAPVRVVGVVMDVTELRRTAEALAVTREQLHLAAEAAEIGTFSWRPDSGTLLWNSQCKQQFWTAPDTPPSLELFFARVHPDDRAAAREGIRRTVEDGDPFDLEYRIVSPEGALRWIHAKGRAYRDAAGESVRFDGITLDVTRQKQTETDLALSEARYRLVIESLPEYAIFILDDAGHITHWNVGAERLLGYTTTEILGRSAHLLFTPEDRARGEPEKEMLTAKTKGFASDDRWHLRKDGSRFFVSGLMCSLQDNQGRRIGLAKIMRDVTERQAAAAERERLLESERAARSEAERTSRLKDEFLATLSHELRTPLNAILGWTQILKTPGLEPADVAQGLEVIDRNTRAQARLIEDLLDMSRIVSGKVRLEVQPVVLSAIVNAAIDSVRTAADAKAIHLTAVVHGAGATVRGDANRLQQVLWNLLTNSIKFTPAGGQVQVSVTREEDHAAVRVADNGAGIEPAFLPHVFERFRQADASTTRQHGGLGLGLSIVKQLVELHGGEVRAESAGAGRGTTFTFTIPLLAAPRVSPPPTPRPSPPSATTTVQDIDLSGVRVLVVDDEPDSAGLVKRVLETQRAEVRVALSMAIALEQFGEFKPHLLLSDIGMPEHDGYELIQRIRELPHGHGVPAAALTALARGEDRSRALQAGFTAHLAKPIEPAELIRVVASLAGRSAPAENRY